jgi:signal transduction histidine kinase
LAVHELIGLALANLRRIVDDRRIQLDLPPDLPPLMVDTELAELALRQVIANALKYSKPESAIAIGARPDGGHVIISVGDQGPGIADKELHHIFEKFYRVGKRTDGVPGTGMGLHIAREIVKAHCGEIWVESVVGQGSKFFLRLPCATDSEQELY